MSNANKKKIDSYERHKEGTLLKAKDSNKITINNDDPLRRHTETTSDIDKTNQHISLLRLKSLEHARKMPTSYNNVSPAFPEEEQYIYSQKAVSGKSNW